MFHHRRKSSVLVVAFVLALCFVTVPGHGSGPISYVGGSNNNGASLSSLTTTYTSTSGNTILVGFIFYNGAGQTISSLTDSGGSHYSKLIEFFPDSSRDIGIWATPNGGAIGSTSFKITFSAAVNFGTMIVEEYGQVNSFGATTSNLEWTANTGSNITASVNSSTDYAICFFGTPDGLTTWAVTTGTLRHFAIAQYPMESVDNAGGTTCASTPNSAVRWGAVSVDAQQQPTTTISGSAGPAVTPLQAIYIQVTVLGLVVVGGIALIVSGKGKKP